MEFQNNPRARRLESVWDNEPVKDLKYAYDDPNSETKVQSLQEIITYLKYLKANGVEPNQNKKSNVYLPFKLRNVFNVFVLLCFLPMVYASTAMGLTETFTSATPRIMGYAMAVILIFILRNGEYLHHHYLQSPATLNPNFPSVWIRRLSAHLFSQDSLALPQLDQKTQNYLILEAANGLGLSHEFLSDPHLIHPQPTLLGPSYFDCQVCGGWLKQTRQCVDIWILEDNGVYIGQLAQGNCQSCNTSHFPDRYCTSINGKLTNIFNPDAAYLCIGGNIWINRQVAQTQSNLCYTAHMSSEGFASFYSQRYGKDKISLLPKHTWKLFVLHESLKLCKATNHELVLPSHTSITALASKMQEKIFPGAVKTIQGALAHQCAQCFHPYRSLQDGTAVCDLLTIFTSPC
ncbi:uncharacterized protein EI90DRAFT_3133025 [Cantharellus anzutake]|uniref:uncharacterized protein n=1 Tax=Cantharellus anzutake TaxID=1750568 RepID=UPI001908591F|nr:uncharacterized protein EI90DRAFT_3133025 [Cantharellus anzutake]KAF8318828.1 hypothetical protein EI90DRAFT_3133025 [Cantharellus anzutake]